MLQKGTDSKQRPAGQPRNAGACAIWPHNLQPKSTKWMQKSLTHPTAEQGLGEEAIASAPSRLGGLRPMSRHPGAPSNHDPNAP